MLCLGDSYTIGESVLPNENFPYQSVRLLKNAGYDFKNPEIVARTGWTTDELANGIKDQPLKNSYDFVTLLIGVNNQYRGRPVEEYIPQFESLLKQAIEFTNGKPGHVMVLSIPDWSATPFAKDRDRMAIAKEIDTYNDANRNISLVYHANYIDITPGTREALSDHTLVAADGLHPSVKEYAKWAERIYVAVKAQLQ
jgi:lysophospholipase L1-like esterase